MKKTLLLVLMLVLALAVVGCTNGNNDVVNTEQTQEQSGSNMNTTATSGENIISGDEVDMNTFETTDEYKEVENNPVVTLEVEGMGIIKMELYPQIAPESVKNFISLVQSGFYDGLVFHRTIPGFMAQGGDPLGNGTGGTDYTIKGEFSVNGVDNKLSHTRGIVSMARNGYSYDSASSQFFIVTTDSIYLDGQYAAFGKVLEGMDVVDNIVNSEVVRREIDENVDYYTNPEEYIKQSLECDRPVNPPVIKSATVDTFGVTYDEPEKLPAAK